LQWVPCPQNEPKKQESRERVRGAGLRFHSSLPSTFETRAYNSLVQLTNVNTNQIQYFYSATNNNGRITSASHQYGGATENLNYSYDSLNRLVGASGNGFGSLLTAWTETHAYDGFGNLADKTPTGGAPTLHQAISPGTNRIVGQTYDNNGNLILAGSAYDYENRLATISGDTYSYDPRNLRTYKFQSTGNVYVYVYDPFGHRMGAYQISSSNNFGVGGPAAYRICGKALASTHRVTSRPPR
jgi:hypothetical protein